MSARRSRLELFEEIRRARRVDPGVSIHELSRRFETHRRTVREALVSAVPSARKPVVDRLSPVMDPWKSIIDGWLTEDLSAPRKQRHTGHRVWERLVDEHQSTAAERTVRKYVKAAKERLGVNEIEVMVPQQHPLGFEAGDLTISSTPRLFLLVRLQIVGLVSAIAWCGELAAWMQPGRPRLEVRLDDWLDHQLHCGLRVCSAVVGIPGRRILPAPAGFSCRALAVE